MCVCGGGGGYNYIILLANSESLNTIAKSGVFGCNNYKIN